MLVTGKTYRVGTTTIPDNDGEEEKDYSVAAKKRRNINSVISGVIYSRYPLYRIPLQHHPGYDYLFLKFKLKHL